MYLDLSPKESRSFLMARGVPATTVDERLRTHEEKIPYIIDYFHGAASNNDSDVNGRENEWGGGFDCLV